MWVFVCDSYYLCYDSDLIFTNTVRRFLLLIRRIRVKLSTCSYCCWQDRRMYRLLDRFFCCTTCSHWQTSREQEPSSTHHRICCFRSGWAINGKLQEYKEEQFGDGIEVDADGTSAIWKRCLQWRWVLVPAAGTGSIHFDVWAVYQDEVWICYHRHVNTECPFQLYYSYFLLAFTTVSLESSESRPRTAAFDLLSTNAATQSTDLNQLALQITADPEHGHRSISWPCEELT